MKTSATLANRTLGHSGTGHGGICLVCLSFNLPLGGDSLPALGMGFILLQHFFGSPLSIPAQDWCGGLYYHHEHTNSEDPTNYHLLVFFVSPLAQITLSLEHFSVKSRY